MHRGAAAVRGQVHDIGYEEGSADANEGSAEVRGRVSMPTPAFSSLAWLLGAGRAAGPARRGSCAVFRPRRAQQLVEDLAGRQTRLDELDSLGRDFEIAALTPAQITFLLQEPHGKLQVFPGDGHESFKLEQ